MKRIISLFSILLLLSCTSKKPDSTLLNLDEGNPITAKEYTNELIMSNPISIDMVDNKLLLVMSSRADNAIWVVDKDKGTLLEQWGKFGNGPQEFNVPMSWGHNASKQEVYLYDMIFKRLSIYNYTPSGDSLAFNLKKACDLTDDIYLSNGTMLKNDNSVASVIFSQTSPILLLDKEQHPIKSFGRLPGQSDSNTDQRFYEGHFSSYGNDFVFAMNRIGYLSLYSQTDTAVQKKWEVYLEKPLYNGDVLAVRTLKQGFIDVKMTKHYIFCSYCGEVFSINPPNSFGNNLLIFDHKGKLLHNLKFDRKIGRIAVSEDEQTVYAIAFQPDICIVRYELEDIL